LNGEQAPSAPAATNAARRVAGFCADGTSAEERGAQWAGALALGAELIM